MHFIKLHTLKYRVAPKEKALEVHKTLGEGAFIPILNHKMPSQHFMNSRDPLVGKGYCRFWSLYIAFLLLFYCVAHLEI